MQKTFLKFVFYELIERIARFELVLSECAEALENRSPRLLETLTAQLDAIRAQLMDEKATLNRLFAEGGTSPKLSGPQLENAFHKPYADLCRLSAVLLKLESGTMQLQPETHLFLKDVLHVDFVKNGGEHTVFLDAEGTAADTALDVSLAGLRIDHLSVLQKNNPLAWGALTEATVRHLVATAENDLKKALPGKNAPLEKALVFHAVNLRLLGPAWYFQALSNAVFRQDGDFLNWIEPALFYGLNHLNFTHKSLVILHEATERSKGFFTEAADNATDETFGEETLAAVFRMVEKLVPARFAFQEKHFERAMQLQERLGQGVLLSSSPLYPIEEVSEKLIEQRGGEADFSIYEMLTMITEYPQTPREIVNAGWLHKMERGPVWLYAVLNEEQDGFAKLAENLDLQDHLLRKSIETSEVHRVLLCTP